MFKSEKADCPLWRAPCKEHQCRWYKQIVGTHPNTGEALNLWDCAIAWFPALLLENAKESRQTAASVDKFRDEMATANGMAQIQQRLINSAEQTLIESK